jgi:hypothetical protein
MECKISLKNLDSHFDFLQQTWGAAGDEQEGCFHQGKSTTQGKCNASM